MGSKGIEVGLMTFVFVVIFSREAMAQSSCMNVVLSMASCLNYVTGSSTTPPASCCSSLANVVQTQPRCLCTVLGGGSQLGVNINSTLALSLPTACKVETPPVSRCNAANGPAMSPVGSPEASPGPGGSADQTPESSTTPSITGSKTTPATATPSNGSVTKIHLQLIGLLLLLVSKFSSF